MLSAVEASLSGMSARDGTRSLEIPRPSSDPHHRTTQPSPSTQSARRRGRFQTCPANQTIHTPIMGVHSSTATPNPLHRRNPPDVGAGFKPALPTKQPHPHHGGTLIRRNTQPSPSTQSARRRGRFQTCPANQTTTPPSWGYTHPPQTFPPLPFGRERVGVRARGGAGHANQTPPSHHRITPTHPITAHQRNQRNQRFRLDFHTTSVV